MRILQSSLNKKINEINKDDCMNTKETIGNLYPDQTLCVRIAENKIAAIGGAWSDSAKELQWVLFS